MSDTRKTDTCAAVSAGLLAASIGQRTGVVECGGDEVPIVLLNNTQSLAVPEKAIALLDARAPAPRRRKGTAKFDELESFCYHVNRFKSDHSVIFASGLRLDAVLDYHPPNGAAWCQHRAVYGCPTSEPWQLWTGLDQTAMSQDEFADLLEERLEDVISGEGYPDPAKLLETARNLRVHTKGTFSRRVHPTTGDFEHVCKEETESSSTPIPRAFLLALPVFVGGELYRVEARVRFQVRGGNASFGFKLHRRDEIVREAFGEVRERAAAACELPVFAGTPES